MITLKVYDIQVWDGGDRHYHKYYTTSEEAAKAWKTENKHDCITERTFCIAESTEELFDMESGEVKRQALAKLTDAEKLELGLI